MGASGRERKRVGERKERSGNGLRSELNSGPWHCPNRLNSDRGLSPKPSTERPGLLAHLPSQHVCLTCWRFAVRSVMGSSPGRRTQHGDLSDMCIGNNARYGLLIHLYISKYPSRVCDPSRGNFTLLLLLYTYLMRKKPLDRPPIYTMHYKFIDRYVRTKPLRPFIIVTL